MLGLEELLQPVSEETPAGADLSYDPERGTIDQAFDISVSIDTNGEATAAAEIDWRPIINLIESQSARTKDVWLAVYLCRAGARSGQLAMVETGAKYLAGLFDRYWDTVHPQLEEYGFQGRKGPRESLTRRAEFLGPLERVVLLEHPRLGRFSGADFSRFRSGADAEAGYGQFRAALAETPDELLHEAIARIDAITAALRQVDAALVAKADGDTGANFQPTYETLAEIRRSVQSFAPTPADEQGAEDETPSGGAAADGPRIAGRVESREDVVKALEAIADYYRRREPASPILAGLHRIRDWVNLDFLTLLEDIAPGALDEAKRVLVSQRKPGGESSW